MCSFLIHLLQFRSNSWRPAIFPIAFVGIRPHWLSRYNFKAWQVEQKEKFPFLSSLKSFYNVLNGNFLDCLTLRQNVCYSSLQKHINFNYSSTYFLNNYYYLELNWQSINLPILRFLGVLAVEKPFKQPCSDIEGWKRSGRVLQRWRDSSVRKI